MEGIITKFLCAIRLTGPDDHTGTPNYLLVEVLVCEILRPYVQFFFAFETDNAI